MICRNHNITNDLIDAHRTISKWLNEEQTAPIDRMALAKLCHGFSVLCNPGETATEQALGLYAIQLDKVKDLLDARAPNTFGNIVDRLDQILPKLPAANSSNSTK